MALYTLRPVAGNAFRYSASSDWDSISATNVADNNTATFITRASTTGLYPSISFRMQNAAIGASNLNASGAIPATQAIVRARGVTIVSSALAGSAYATLYVYSLPDTSNGSETEIIRVNSASVPGTTTTLATNWVATAGGKRLLASTTSTALNNVDTWFTKQVAGYSGNYPATRIREQYIEVETTSIPTVSGLTATTTQNTLFPTFSYTYADTDGGSQTLAEVWVIAEADYIALGSDPTVALNAGSSFVQYTVTNGAGSTITTTAGTNLTYVTPDSIYAAGASTPSVKSAALTPGVTYRAITRVGKTDAAGNTVYSAPVAAAATFTVTIVPPPLPTFFASWDSVNQKTDLQWGALVNALEAGEANPEGTNGASVASTEGNGTWFMSGTNANITLTYSTAVGGAVAAAGNQPSSGTAALAFNVAAGNTSTTLIASTLPHLLRGGQSITGSVYLRSSVGVNATIRLAWFTDEAGTVALSGTPVSTGTSATTSTSAWTQYVVQLSSAPVGAVSFRLQVIYSLTAAVAYTHYLDAAHVYVSNASGATIWSVGGWTQPRYSLTRDTTVCNLIPNPSPVAGSAPWAFTSASSAGVSFNQAFTGTFSFSWMATAANSSAASGGTGGLDGAQVVGSRSYTASGYVNSSAARSWRLDVQWFNSSGTSISTTTGSVVAVAANTWTRLTLTATSPNGAAYARLIFTSTTSVNGDLNYVDAAMLHPTTPDGLPLEFFDGDTAGAKWVGTSHLSASVTREYSAERPPVYATWASLSSGVQARSAITLVQAEPGKPGDRTLGQIQQFKAVDYEAPRAWPQIGYALTEQIQLRGTDSVITQTVTAVVTTTTDTLWWIKAVDSPELNVGGLRVQVGVGSQMDEQNGVFQPLGRARPVVTASVLSGSNDTYEIVVQGAAEWRRMRRILETQTVLLIQEPATIGGTLPQQRYIRIVNRSWTASGNATNPVRRVTLSTVEVDGT